jgi:2-haloacid dehalogenase/putative hydrolase of the HAD superfamily
VLGEQLLALVLEEVHVEARRAGAGGSLLETASGAPRGRPPSHNMPALAMPLPALKTIKWVTTDCYGTLIDWEKGILDACRKEAEKDGFSFDEEPFLARFMEVQAEIMAGSYELYAEVLRRTIVKVAGEIGWEVEPSRAQFLPDSIAYWLPFREANAAMDRLGKRYEVGIISNIDDKMLGISRRHLRTELDLVVTAQQVRSYKPDPVHFKECARRIGGKKGWLHIGSNYAKDVAPLLKMNVPVIWVNRHDEKLEGRKAPSATVKNFRDAAKKLGAS